jgi:hypothetical protein
MELEQHVEAPRATIAGRAEAVGLRAEKAVAYAVHCSQGILGTR